MSYLQVTSLSKTYRGQKAAALNNVSFTLEQGTILAVVGLSGSGKSTLLRLLAGLEKEDSGSIQLNDFTLTAPDTFLPPEKRQVGLVFQDFALFPNMTVEQNIRYGLFKLPKGEQQQRVNAMLHLAGLEALRRKYPHQLSGGEQQRVALVRALAPQPLLMLLDEPFSNLDMLTKKQVRTDTFQLLRENGSTAIMVTHDMEDALAYADYIMVLNQGRIEQLGTPQELQQQPASELVKAMVEG